jgi:hypothetical protein
MLLRQFSTVHTQITYFRHIIVLHSSFISDLPLADKHKIFPLVSILISSVRGIWPDHCNNALQKPINIGHINAAVYRRV